MIRIIRGVYGHYVNGTVQAKGVDSPPFAITPEKEERLVAQGVAVYVDDVPTAREELPELPPDVTAISEYSIDMKPDELRAIAKQMGQGVAVYVDDVPTAREELPELPPDVTAISEYSIDMKPDELRAIAKQMGLTFKFGTSKADMVTAMDRFIEDHMELDDMDDADVNAPMFDAAEAVL